MDTRDINAQNLLFLLSAAPLSIGCVITTGDDAATTNPPPTSGPNTSGDTDQNTGTMPPDTDSPTSTGTTVSAEDTTVGAEDTTVGPAETVGETAGPVQCYDYAGNITYCYDDKAGGAAYDSCVEYYYMLYYDYGEACATAFGEFMTCLSTLTCEELMEADPCLVESEAFALECFG